MNPKPATETSDALIVRTLVVEVKLYAVQLALRVCDAVVKFVVGCLVDGA
jgi:hypothetical protein